jgi:glucose-6-phosphate isomerase
MITTGIKLINFKKKTNSLNIKKNLKLILKEKNQVIESLKTSYQNSFERKKILKYKKASNFRIIGMGGSSLGSNAIYDFLKKKIKKNFLFFDNLQTNLKVNDKKKYTNLIISKSGNTVETIVNANILIKKKDQNIFITEKKNSYLHILANKLKAEIIHHNNYIGGRYSVLSEVGMVPSELMGLNSSKFKQLNNLIKNKKFMNNLVLNVESILYFSKKKKIQFSNYKL